MMLLNADAVHIPLKSGTVQTCVTSPPYYGLRKYGDWFMATLFGSLDDFQMPRKKKKRARWFFDMQQRATLYGGKYSPNKKSWIGHFGLEDSPEEYVDHIVMIFRDVRRVLRDDGTVWINLGDSYAGSMKGYSQSGYSYGGEKQKTNAGSMGLPPMKIDRSKRKSKRWGGGNIPATGDLKPKDLIGIPWMVAFALRADGWYLRSEIIWHKTNPMPESVRDRPTKAHEQIFLLSKSKKYYYDADAIKEPAVESNWTSRYDRAKEGQKAYPTEQVNGIRSRSQRDSFKRNGKNGQPEKPQKRGERPEDTWDTNTRNKRSVWTVNTKPYAAAHFATYPPDLIEPCILAGTSERGQCPVCGTPWVRVTEKSDLISTDGTSDDYKPKKITDDRKVKGRSEGWTPNHYYDKETIGWKPTCTCNAGDPVPQIVLDPFGGSGTTGEVAARHRRRYVLLDLSMEYIGLQRERTTVDVRLPL